MSGFYADAGRMYITDGSGNTIFDTNEGLFVVTDTLSGSKVIPARTTTFHQPASTVTHLSVNTNHSISTSINSAADTVRGTFNVTVSTQGALTNAGEYNAGGSYMHYTQGQEQETAAWPQYWPGVIAFYTFVASGGNLDLNEQTYGRPPIKVAVPVDQVTTILSSTLNYDLIIGTFV